MAAAVVHFVVTGLFNGVILREELRAWMEGGGNALHPLSPPTAMMLWALMSVCYGLIGMWYYAGMRSRRGAGQLTALLVGLSLWAVAKATVALDLVALGVMPRHIIADQTLGGLVAIVLAIMVGAGFYEGRRPR